MTIAFVLKILGGLILLGAHRTLIRAAREEGTGWWIATMVIPGAAIFYGLRNFRAFAQTFVALAIGAVISVGGFGLGIYDRVHEMQATAATSSSSDDEDDEDDEEPGALHHATAVTLQPATPKPLPGDLQKRVDQLQKSYAAMTADRAKLDEKNADAVRAFNLRAGDYQSLKRQLEAEVADFNRGR
jgi:hypothetical protein